MVFGTNRSEFSKFRLKFALRTCCVVCVKIDVEMEGAFCLIKPSLRKAESCVDIMDVER